MSTTEALGGPHRYEADPYKLGRGGGGRGFVSATGHGAGGPASKRVVVGYGFWLFLLSDIVLFSCLFAAHAVLRNATAGGPTGPQLFNPTIVAVETACLLASTFVAGLAAVAAGARNLFWTEVLLFITGIFGLAFLLLEASDFASMVARGAGPTVSAYWSSFFTLVGCHGCHVSLGLLWLGTMMAQVFFKGFRPNVMRRLVCYFLFWHMLDIIWVALFTVAYLIGEGR